MNKTYWLVSFAIVITTCCLLNSLVLSSLVIESKPSNNHSVTLTGHELLTSQRLPWRYLKYNDMTKWLLSLPDRYPHLAHVYSIGKVWPESMFSGLN